MDRSYVGVTNGSGTGPYVFVCEHASNEVPSEFGSLGLGAEHLRSHIAWDPGAFELACQLAERFNAPMVHARVSRLVLDCNRSCDSETLVPTLSETVNIPGNLGFKSEDKQRRIALIHEPFHAKLEQTITTQHKRVGIAPVLVTIHSFTPVFKGQKRQTECGFLHGDQDIFARACLVAACKQSRYRVDLNEPYGPTDDVMYTIDRHGNANGLLNIMIEIRHDLLACTETSEPIASWLASVLQEAFMNTANHGIQKDDI